MKTPIKLSAVVLASVVFLTACQDDKNNAGDAQADGQKATQNAYSQLSKAVPYVAPKNSLERRNLAERLKRTDNPNAIGYVYLLSFGKPLGYYTIKGKVSNPDSQLTTIDLVQYACDDGLSGCQAMTVPAPGDDGSYGPNEGGIFFFTTEGTMVTTDLDYVWSDQILPFNVPELNKH